MTVALNPDVNSREYAFVYPIRAPEHLPPDFPVEADFAKLVSGIFLPQDQCGWLNKPRYPAHVLLLLKDELWAATHPASREPEGRIRLKDILAIESTQVLLDGRFTVCTPTSEHRWRYNTRDERHVSAFLLCLRRAVTVAEGPSIRVNPVILGDPLDLKFASAESRELDPGERILVRIFCAPKRTMRRKWVFKVESWVPAEYFAVTSRRILWITDRVGGSFQKYGTISRYAALERLSGLTFTCLEDKYELGASLGGHLQWRLPFSPELARAAQSFVECVRDLESWLAAG